MTDSTAAPRPVGTLKIAYNVPPLPTFAHASDITFQPSAKLQKRGDRNQLMLRGYTATATSGADSTPNAQASGADLTVGPGNEVTYEFSWQSDQAVADGTQ